MKEQVEAFYDAVQQQYENAAAGNGPEQFYRGTLRSGQVISSESSVTIIGDVNPGAKIISQGNIVILGALKVTHRQDVWGIVTALFLRWICSRFRFRLGI